MKYLFEAAQILGGHVSNDQILCPGPGHSAEDRSLSVKIDPSYLDGFISHSFANDDQQECRDYLKRKIGALIEDIKLSAELVTSQRVDTTKPRAEIAASTDGLLEACRGAMRDQKPDQVYLYRDSTGAGIIQATARWDSSNSKKAIRPFYFVGDSWKCGGLPFPRPLYRLDQINAYPNKVILIVEGEKCAEAASSFYQGIVTTWAGGAGAIHKTDFSPLRGRDVILWPDNDAVGSKAMQVIAQKIGAYVRSVSVIDLGTLSQDRPLGATLPDGWDVADAISEGWLPQDLEKSIAGAKQDYTFAKNKDVAPVALVAPVEDEEPLPLFSELPCSQPYPTEALGEVLGTVAKAIANKCQVPEAMAAQSVISAACLAIQTQANISLPFGQSRPISLFMATIAQSGDRKSTSDNEALRGVRAYEEVLRAKYKEELKEYYLLEAAYNSEKRKIENTKGIGYAEKASRLRDLGERPQKPIQPMLTVSDPTIEGIQKNLPELPAGLAIYSTEGGQFTGGYGMADENRLRTSATLSAYWDGSPIKRLRAGDGASSSVGRRLSLHLMVQPEVAQKFLGDTTLRDQGLLSRFLIAAPESLAGTRYHKPVSESDAQTIKDFASKIQATLSLPQPLIEGSRNEVAPRSIPLDEEAKSLFYNFSDHLEKQMGKGGELERLRDFAAKAPEIAVRIAAILTLIENIAAQAIPFMKMQQAMLVIEWYIREAGRLYEAHYTDPNLIKAQDLLNWLIAGDALSISFRDVLRNGPKYLRTKAKLSPIIKILVDHKWLVPTRLNTYLVRRKGGA